MKLPLPNSYWVLPGRLLAGEHPDGGSVSATRSRISKLLAAGVRSFVDLTHPDELPSYRELLPEGIGYQNFPMPDHSVPESLQQMREVQRALAAGSDAGLVYLHCRAGIGRTGLTVGCFLRELGESPWGALDELNRLWQQNARAAGWPVIPETSEQEAFVREWQVVTGSTADQRWRGSLLGLALGDALVHSPDAGVLEWTDDTAMALCVAESLLACGGFDGRDQLTRFREWAQNPELAGAAAGAALRPSVQEVLARSLWSRSAVLGSHDPGHVDSAPLSRSVAAPLFIGARMDAAASLAADCTRVTHQSPLLVDASRLLAVMIALALAGRPRDAVLAGADQPMGLPLREELQSMAAEWIVVAAGRRKPLAGFMGVLDRAVRCFARSRTFGDGLQRALDSPGAERDVVCAVYGALAGAFYGESGIADALRQRMPGQERLLQLADRLYQREGARHGAAG